MCKKFDKDPNNELSHSRNIWKRGHTRPVPGSSVQRRGTYH